jgi:hypothetical protein
MISINERNVQILKKKIQSVRLARMVAALSLRRDVMCMLIHKKMITMRLRRIFCDKHECQNHINPKT